MPTPLPNGRRARIALITSPIATRIAVHNIAIQTRRRNANAIAGAHDRREVTYADQPATARRSDSHEGNHVLVGVVGIDPLETRRLMVSLPQSRLSAINAIEIADQVLDATMVGLVKQIPIKAGVVIPFAPLAKRAAHEESLFARSRPHVTEQRAQVGELLPSIAGHLVEQRAFAVNDLVVRKRQHEVFVPRVHQSKRQIAVMKSAVDRSVAEVVERIVHPSHVPLEAQTNTTPIHAAPDPRP